MAGDGTGIPSLYTIAIEAVLRQHINEENDHVDLHYLPDKIINDLLAEVGCTLCDNPVVFILIKYLSKLHE